MPNFLIIGAMKAGTTSLYEYLRKHPQIYMSRVKEPVLLLTLEAYLTCFDGVTDERAIGEASAAYLHILGAPRRIRQLLPGVRLIAVLRHPVDRAYSHYTMHRLFGWEPLKSFELALQAEPLRIQDNWGQGWGYKQIGAILQNG